MFRRDFLKSGVALGAFAGARSLYGGGFQQSETVSVATAPSSKWSGDMALINAKIMTVDANQPEAQAALVRGGRIVLVGSTKQIMAQAKGVKVFDAHGRTVVPGFVDGHTHVEVAAASNSYSVDVHPAKSIPEMQAILKKKAATLPSGAWVIGRGDFGMDRTFAEKRYANLAEMDAVSQDRPVIVFSGRHNTMANSVAFKAMGVWEPDAKLPRGTFIHRDESGKPNGYCTEVFYYLPEFSLAEMKAALKEHTPELCTTRGTTSMYTICFSGNDVRADIELQRMGEMPLRVRTYYHVPHMMSFDDLMGTGFVAGIGDDMFRFGGMKLFVDGPGFDNAHPETGMKYTQDELNHMVSGADAAGMQILMHVVTVAGYKMATEAIAEARRRNPVRPSITHRIEHHGDDGTAEGIKRMQDLNFRVAITPDKRKPGSAGGYLKNGPRYKSLIDAHVDPVVITDTTGTTPGQSDILTKIAIIAATPEQGGGTSPEEVVSFSEALRLFTLNNAKVCYEDRYKGSITPGKLADFVVISGDPRNMSPDKLFGLKVEATIVGGEVVFGA